MKTPTPIRSPILNLVAADPSEVTVPTISWPGTIGKIAFPHSSLT